MLLNTRRWGSVDDECVVCIHGLTHHGGVFDVLGARLAEAGRFVVAVDLRGHGDSGFEPPWSEDTHIGDLLETLDALGVGRVSWIGHSFGGRLAASAAVRCDRTECLVMLDPGFGIPPAVALRAAETERLDWSFATVEGAIQAILSSPTTVSPPADVVAAFVEDDIRQGPDGRWRYRFSPAAAVVAWSDMALPSPEIAGCPTLVVRPAVSHLPPFPRARYEAALGDLLRMAEVPNGHNMLWEAPRETAETIEGFLEARSLSARR